MKYLIDSEKVALARARVTLKQAAVALGYEKKP
jgi:hypothetical protein